MNEGFVFDAFLSHSSRDKNFIPLVPERSRKDGLKAWFDEWVLKPADSVPATIEDGLEHLRALPLNVSAWAQLVASTLRHRDSLNQRGAPFHSPAARQCPHQGHLGAIAS